MSSRPASKPERQEQSAQFSLQGLMRLEDERLADLKRDREARERAEVEAREEAGRRARAALEARAREETERRDRARQDELDAIARREAIQKAAVEQSRLEVEVRARAEERELERRHELELARLRTDAPDARTSHAGSLSLATLFGGGAMLLVVIGVYFGAVKPAAEHRIAELAAESVGERDRADALVRGVEEQRRRADALERAGSAQAQELAQLRNRCASSSGGATSTGAGAGARPTTSRGPGGRGPSTPPPPRAACVPGDPMCGVIPR